MEEDLYTDNRLPLVSTAHWDEELALRHVVREYVRFWHVHICKKPEGDLDDYWPLLTRRAVERES